MKMKIRIEELICFFICGALIFWNCQNSTESDNPVPARVILVEKSAEDDSIETGIDAEFVRPQQNGIILQWHPVGDNDLAAYDIYRSAVDSNSAFRKIGTVLKSLNNVDTFYVDKSPEIFPGPGMPASRYYYYVVARDEEGGVGERSRVDNYKLEEICTLNAPNDQSMFEGNFDWDFPPIQPDVFIFRLMKDGVPIYVKRLQNDYSADPWSQSELGLDSLESGSYQWRIDIIGADPPNNGSESAWLGFTVQ